MRVPKSGVWPEQLIKVPILSNGNNEVAEKRAKLVEVSFMLDGGDMDLIRRVLFYKTSFASTHLVRHGDGLRTIDSLFIPSISIWSGGVSLGKASS